ncbi:TPA: hypothetical protein ACKQGZ_001204 [Serratia marcescens]|uniref:hypothetical protein n=1 Tax=Serratia TaxID=613 RepID=UPI0018D60794|nr:hypothetical protein [Serratia ureilytica]MBH3075874.1 hypothetical protein [Serratia ureilytica]
MPQLSKFDILSSRLANLSQVGLLLLAGFGYFYTVIPVYQKSLLDEEIAKKTLEINEKDKNLERLNTQYKQKIDEFSKISAEVEQAKKEASESKRNYQLMRSKYSHQYSELRTHLFGQFIIIGGMRCKVDMLRDGSLSRCLVSKVVKASELKELTSRDSQLLERIILNEVSIAAKNYNQKHSKVISEANKKIDLISKELELCQKENEGSKCSSLDIKYSLEKNKKEFMLFEFDSKVMDDLLNSIATKAANTR